MATSEQIMRSWFPTWQDAARYLSEQLGKGATRQLAAHTGRNIRSAQRWVKAAKEGGRYKMNPAVGASIIALAASRKVLASQGRVGAGWVDVTYDGRPEGKRRVGRQQISPADLAAVGGLLAAGRWAEASEEFDQALLHAYGIEGDGEIQIGNYRDGLDLS